MTDRHPGGVREIDLAASGKGAEIFASASCSPDLPKPPMPSSLRGKEMVLRQEVVRRRCIVSVGGIFLHLCNTIPQSVDNRSRFAYRFRSIFHFYFHKSDT